MDLWSQFLVVKTNKSWNHKRIQYAKDHKKNSVINVTTSAKVFRRSQQIFVEIFRITCLWSEVLKQSLNRVWYYAPKVGLRSTYLYKESWNESRIMFWFLCAHHDRLKLRCNLYIKHDAKWCIFTWFTVAVKHENTKKQQQGKHIWLKQISPKQLQMYLWNQFFTKKTEKTTPCCWTFHSWNQRNGEATTWHSPYPSWPEIKK